ncbi:MAG: DNA mismatch repair endonuclease MutL, partial [Oscillospiraceae bacterium]|nr:DNA mismatch repair endonuclease MutL [Oscillospiraceae bacterium]
KELVENALDAGATKIDVELRQNGIASIQVTDNGKGIHPVDIKTAFLRHATSKIRDAADLDAIGSLGFRGEALAAIAAVSRVRMVSRPKDAAEGCLYELEGGVETAFERCGAPFGTTITVSDLFFNTPARMKFLKKDVAEGNAVEQLLWHIALTEPNVAFRLVRDGKVVLRTSGQGLYAAIFDLYPREIAQSMVPVSFEGEGGVLVSGYVAAPRDARASRSLQHVSVNGRYIRSRAIQSAAEEACRGFVMQGRYPAFVLQILLPLDDVDVNVHPAKTEVRFRSERAVTSAVYHGVRAAVSQSAAHVAELQQGSTAQPEEEPVLSLPPLPEALQQVFEPAAMPETQPAEEPALPQLPAYLHTDAFAPQPASEKENSVAEKLPPRPDFLQAAMESDLSDLPFMAFAAAPKAMPEQPQGVAQQLPLYDAFDAAQPARSEQPAQQLALETAPIKIIGELFSTYILCEAGEQLILIDMHAAHERILFEKLRAADGAAVESQLLLEPITVSLSLQELQALTENTAALQKLGFAVEQFGEREVAVREAPTYLKVSAVADAVAEMASSLAEGRQTLTFEAREWLLHSVACRAAIKAGHKAPCEEMAALANEILLGSVPKYCPHGRPVYVAFSRSELEKRFGRLV